MSFGRSAAALLLASITLWPGTAYAQRHPSGASVSGTLYVRMPDGTLKRTGEQTITVLRDSDDLRTRVAQVCRAQEQDTRSTHDSLERLRKQVGDTMTAPTEDPWTDYWGAETAIRTAKTLHRRVVATSNRSDIRNLIRAAVVDSVRTSASAEYQLVGLAAGKYILVGERLSGSAAYRWWNPIELADGMVARRNLTGTMEPLDQCWRISGH